MDNLSPAQYDRFEAYRRHALPKQAVRKVIQQTLGQQVSQPVAQIIAGFSKVFVGEIVEKGESFVVLSFTLSESQQHGLSKHGEAKVDHYHQTICEKPTGLIKKKQVMLELQGHYAEKSFSCGSKLALCPRVVPMPSMVFLHLYSNHIISFLRAWAL